MTERTSHWRDCGSALPLQTRLTQTKQALPLSNEHGSQVKDEGRQQCCHNKHKKFPYRPTRDISLLSGHVSCINIYIYDLVHVQVICITKPVQRKHSIFFWQPPSSVDINLFTSDGEMNIQTLFHICPFDLKKAVGYPSHSVPYRGISAAEGCCRKVKWGSLHKKWIPMWLSLVT